MTIGFGLGLRAEHYETLLNIKNTEESASTTEPPIDWLEIISENYINIGGKPLYYLDKIREKYPIAMHGVSLSIGSTDPLDFEYLNEIKKLKHHLNPIFISDHLCWTGVGGINIHDLLPLPYTEEALNHVVARLKTVQDFLECPILLENVSSYITYKHSIMTEWDFLRTIVEEANANILLDINNIYVSAFNHHFDPKDYLQGIPVERVLQFHLAGHSHQETHIIDTHDSPIIEPVWDLYKEAIKRFGGNVATLIERDDNIPPLEELLLELAKAKTIHDAVLKNPYHTQETLLNVE